MPVTAAGSLSLWQVGVQTLLAACPAFQALFADEEGFEDDPVAVAKLHIFFDDCLLEESDDDGAETLDDLRPFAVVQWLDFAYVAVAEGSGLELAAGGGVSVDITDLPGAGLDEQEAIITFTNLVGQILDEMALRSGEDKTAYGIEGESDTFVPVAIRLAVPPVRTPRHKRTAGHDHFGAILQCTFGHNGAGGQG